MMCCGDELPALVPQLLLLPCVRLREALSRPSVVALELEVQFLLFLLQKKKNGAQIISSDKEPRCRLITLEKTERRLK